MGALLFLIIFSFVCMILGGMFGSSAFFFGGLEIICKLLRFVGHFAVFIAFVFVKDAYGILYAILVLIGWLLFLRAFNILMTRLAARHGAQWGRYF